MVSAVEAEEESVHHAEVKLEAFKTGMTALQNAEYNMAKSTVAIKETGETVVGISDVTVIVFKKIQQSATALEKFCTIRQTA